MTGRYPEYDVLSKQLGMSWNEVTRRVIAARLAVPRQPRFFNAAQWLTLTKLCARILPQPTDREAVPLPAYIDEKLLSSGDSGTRIDPMPYDGEAWRTGLDALDAEAQAAHGRRFHELADNDADALLRLIQNGDAKSPAWGKMTAEQFFTKRVLQDIPAAYYAHPTAWSELGFGGPASPRGYVRLEANRRDPWEAAEAHPGEEERARRANRDVR